MESVVLLREVRRDDLPIFFAQQLDPEANTMAAFAARDSEAFMARWDRTLADATAIKQTIVCNDRVAGNIGCFEQDGQREVGYWLGREYWGRGIATRALAAFLDQVPLRPLHAYVARHNIASRRVLEKCGFTVVGEDKNFTEVAGETIEATILKLEATVGDAAL